MAEYYPLLAKAVGSLPNSTPDTRRIVYERARKALIGQLRTLHPPIPDEEIENESVALDLAIERLEGEIANGSVPAAPPPAPPKTPDVAKPVAPPEPPKSNDATAAEAPKPDAPKPVGAPPFAPRAPRTPLRPPSLRPPTAKPPAGEPLVAKAPEPPADQPKGGPPAVTVPVAPPAPPPGPGALPPPGPSAPGPGAPPPVEDAKRLKPPRPDRPIAPQPPSAEGPKRRLWILPVAVGLVVAGVAFAAWKLRDHPSTIAQKKPAEATQTDSNKIAERVGGPKRSTTEPSTTEPPTEEKQPEQKAPQPDQQEKPAEAQPATPANPPQQAQGQQPQQPAAPATNPEVQVAHRAALLVQAPDEPNKIKTFLGRVVWKLNNAPQGPNDAVGVAVEADIELPDDKMKVVVTFAKNTEASLPASHTINIKFMVEPGSYTGDVKQINVPQMRPEDNPGGEPLAGVTVQIVPNSFLVGLSPGNAETANTELIRKLQWIDIPLLLDNGKLAKLTFEKGDSGQRDLNEAFDAWQKQ